MFTVQTKFPGGETFEDGPFPTRHDAEQWAKDLPYYNDTTVDIALINESAPTLYQDAPHFCLKRIDEDQFVCACSEGLDYLVITDTRQQALDMATSTGTLEFTEPLQITPRTFKFCCYYKEGTFYAL